MQSAFRVIRLLSPCRALFTGATDLHYGAVRSWSSQGQDNDAKFTAKEPASGTNSSGSATLPTAKQPASGSTPSASTEDGARGESGSATPPTGKQPASGSTPPASTEASPSGAESKDEELKEVHRKRRPGVRSRSLFFLKMLGAKTRSFLKPLVTRMRSRHPQQTTTDKYLRALAETENVRQRMSKQVQDAKLFGIQGFAKDMLEVADILENANNSITEEVLQRGSKPLIALVEGLKLTEAELQKAFKANGLTKIDGKGDKFDPALHEALFEVPGEKPGIVAVVSRYGYMLHGRTLRPARVGVVKSKT